MVIRLSNIAGMGKQNVAFWCFKRTLTEIALSFMLRFSVMSKLLLRMKMENGHDATLYGLRFITNSYSSHLGRKKNGKLSGTRVLYFFSSTFKM